MCFIQMLIEACQKVSQMRDMHLNSDPAESYKQFEQEIFTLLYVQLNSWG